VGKVSRLGFNLSGVATTSGYRRLGDDGSVGRWGRRLGHERQVCGGWDRRVEPSGRRYDDDDAREADRHGGEGSHGSLVPVVYKMN
jgi:hypothetical protein